MEAEEAVDLILLIKLLCLYFESSINNKLVLQIRVSLVSRMNDETQRGGERTVEFNLCRIFFSGRLVHLAKNERLH